MNKLRETVLAILESKLALAREFFEHPPDGPWVISQRNGTSIDSVEHVREPDGSHRFRVEVSREDSDEVMLLSLVELHDLIGRLAPVDFARVFEVFRKKVSAD